MHEMREEQNLHAVLVPADSKRTNFFFVGAFFLNLSHLMGAENLRERSAGVERRGKEDEIAIDPGMRNLNSNFRSIATCRSNPDLKRPVRECGSSCKEECSFALSCFSLNFVFVV